MLATIALGAAQVCFGPGNRMHMYNLVQICITIKKNMSLFLQSPFGVASGAIAGHLVATFLAIVGGAFLANYLSEKLVKVFCTINLVSCFGLIVNALGIIVFQVFGYFTYMNVQFSRLA